MPQAKIIKIEVTKNYIIADYKNPSKSKIIKYVRKEIISKNGDRNLLTLAVVKDDEGNTKLIPTSFWRPINSKSGKKILREYLKNSPKKVHFYNNDIKKKYLKETKLFNRSIVKYVELNEVFF